MAKCKEVEAIVKKGGIRVHGDYRDSYTPGWKFNDWELKGNCLEYVRTKEMIHLESVLFG